jgi:hypothetical protein
MRAVLPALASLVLGCRPPDPAPVELDDLTHFFLAQVHEQEHERIVEGTANLLAWYADSGLAGGGPAGGMLSDLSQAEVDALEELVWSPDPEPCAGVYAVSELSCDLDSAAAISLEPDQLEVFVDNYKAYDRVWDSEPGCYVDGSWDAVDWTSTIEDNFVGTYGEMVYQMVVKLRRSRDDEGAPAAMLIRSVMPDVAQEDVGVGGFEQSYHVEVYAPRQGGGLLHLYGMWSHGWMSGIDDDADLWPNQYLEGLLDFELQLEELCVNGW